MTGKSEQATYTHGHHASVLRSHTWRTALNSAAYLLPRIKPDMKILDIGCGPGTITADLATYVPQGHVTGLEPPGDVLAKASALAKERGIANIDFVEGDANALQFADDTFDIVHCHQVLQHVKDPVGILKEMRRVAKKGGIVAARESDYGSFTWFPAVDGMTTWQGLYRQVAAANGGEPDAGRMIHAWAKRAGFPKNAVECSSSVWCYASDEEVKWWSDLWAERTVASSFAKTAVDNGLAKTSDLDGIAQIWRTWGASDDAWFTVPSGEVICHKE